MKNRIDFNNNYIDYIEKILFKEKQLFTSEEGIHINKINTNNVTDTDEINIDNSKEINQLKEVIIKLENSKNKLKAYNFKQEGKILSKKFFEQPNINNLSELINILLEGFLQVNIIIDINQIIIFANFMLYYINKTDNKFKGLIGENYYGNKTIIITMLALAHGLNGKSVDIITPSEYLSENYNKKYQEIYSLFGIYSSKFYSNLDSNIQIIYGTLKEFQLNILIELFNLRNNFNYQNNIRDKNVIIFSEINDMTNSNSMRASFAFSNNFSENYIWVYKPIYNLLKNYNNNNKTFNFLDMVLRVMSNDIEIINALKQVNNGQYKDKVDLIPKELINEWINTCFIALTKKNGVDYIKELVDGEYKIYLIDKKTGNIEKNLIFNKYLHPFIEIKETIIPNNLSYNLAEISKLVFINYYYQNIFAIGGKVDDKKVYKIYNIDSFDCLYNYKIPKVQEKICSDKKNKFIYIKNYIETNYNK